MVQLSRKCFLSCSLCNNKKYTGLNLTLEVFCTGDIDPKNNLVINFFDIDQYLQKQLKLWDHKEFVDISFSDLAVQMATQIKLTWPFKKAKFSKIKLFVAEPFKQLEVC